MEQREAKKQVAETGRERGRESGNGSTCSRNPIGHPKARAPSVSLLWNAF